MRVIRVLLIIFILAGVAGGGFYIYQKYYQFSNKSALELIAPDAVFVFETEQPVFAWNQLMSQPFWDRMSDMPSLQNAANQLQLLDSLFGQEGEMEKALRGNQFVLSMHPIGKEEFDFLYAIALGSGTDFEFLENLESKIPPLSQINTRNYSNVTIKEFQSLDLERNLSYTLINNVLIISYTSFLVEEAIRYSQNSGIDNFKSRYKELFDAQPKTKGLGIVRVSSQGFARLAEGISRDQDLDMIKSFGRSNVAANLELKFSDEKIILDGLAVFVDGKEVDFSHKTGVQGRGVNQFVSNRTSVYFNYNLKSPRQLKGIQDVGFQFKSTLKGDVDKNLIQRGFLEDLTGELGYMLFELSGTEQQDRILLINTESPEQQIKLLKEFNSGLDKMDISLVPVDYYRDQEIFVVVAEEFPAHLFEGKFVGFPDTYITALDDYLIFANSSKAMKIYLDDYFNDNTWGKSVSFKNMLESISPNVGFNFTINIPKFYSSLVEVSSPNWKAFFQKYAPQLTSIDLMTMQVRQQDKGSQVNLEFGYNPQPIKAIADVVLSENRSVQFENMLVYGPRSIQNFVDRSTEFVVQDTENVLHLLSSDGEPVFSLELDSKIVSQIYQVDYFRNGKLQMLFATSEQVYIVDRLGSLVQGFPVKPTEGDLITHLNLVDYNNDRDYRYFLGTESGNLFLLDRVGKGLDGWNPLKINAPLATKPAHHRIAGVGDRMLGLATNGELYFFSRRGEAELGSPIRLGNAVDSDYILVERGSARDTRVVTITSDGEIVHTNLRGEVAFRNQLERPDRESKFNLVKDQKDDRYLFTVHEFNKVTALNPDGKELFVVDIFSENLTFQLFSFGADRNIFVVVDRDQEFIFLYNLKGELLNSRPLGGTGTIDLRHVASQNEYVIYVREGNRFKEYKLPL
ncbi:hypothetical protein [Mongoliibacter ruber]|uniref:DUF3352 domain-containing protein n=1 Tax=Mongoliibacter ruber TaxID=1750599 RepID=A0A2T0WF84_9BACT|nr:hypothetical protein [Mongoliibacter ruber]PRY85326.1 hypothetical protein CLW00_11375 [Mongoliibacter ruber]